jgi:hypothetical protein
MYTIAISCLPILKSTTSSAVMLHLDKGLVQAALVIMGQGSSIVRERRGRWRIILQSGATHLLAPLDTVVRGDHSINTFSIMPGV